MPAVHGKNTYVKWGTNNISAYLSDASLPRTKDEVDVTTFTATGKSFVVGLEDNTLSVSGPDDSAIDAMLGPDFTAGTSRAVEYATNGATASSSNPVYSVTSAYITSYEKSSSVSGAATFSATFRLNGTVTRTTS